MNFVDIHRDRWRTPCGEDGPIVTLNPAPNCLLTQLQWNGVRSHWPADMPVGLLLANDVDVETIGPDLPRLELIALQFPKWTDGRAYSQAHLLRSRYRWPGEIRATGEVLVDMMPLLQRNGFDSAVLRADQSRAAAERALTFFQVHYQGDVRGHPPLFARPGSTVDRGDAA